MRSTSCTTTFSRRSSAFRKAHWPFLLASALVWLLGGVASIDAQDQNGHLNAIGIPTYTGIVPVESGFIKAANGALHLEIPLGTFPQRGVHEFKAALIYDSNIWSGGGLDGNIPAANDTISRSLGGWRLVTSADPGVVSNTFKDGPACNLDGGTEWTSYGNYVWYEPNGTSHGFNAGAKQTWPTRCTTAGGTFNGWYALDSSGYYMSGVYAPSAPDWFDITVRAPDGTQVYPKVEDSNGNYFTFALADNHNFGESYYGGSFPAGTVKDSLGRTLFTVSITCPSGPPYNNCTTIYIDVLNSQGTTSRYTVATQQVPLYASFPGGYIFSGHASTGIQSVQLPDGTSYSFKYDCDSSSGNPACGSPAGQYYYGELTSMTLPAGGQIKYSYATQTYNGNYVQRAIVNRTTPDSPTAWVYALQWDPTTCTAVTNSAINSGCLQSFRVTKPNGDVDVYTMTVNGGAWPTTAQFYTGASTLLATINQSFNFSTPCPANTSCKQGTAIYVTKSSEARTLYGPTSVTQTTQFTWDGPPSLYGNLITKKEWNFGSNTSNAADRTTTTSYLNGANYIGPNVNILNRPQSVTITNSAGTTVAQTTYCYDYANGCGGSSFISGAVGSCPAVTGSANHDDTNYGATNTVRGDVTQAHLYTTSANYLSNSTTYDITGQIRTSTDASGNTTTYCDADSFVNGSPSVATNAYRTTTTNALNQSTKNTYYYGSGLLQSTTDPNIQATSISYDGMGRRTSTTYPDGGQTGISYNYNGAVLSGSTTTKKITSSLNLVTTKTLDGLGRDSSDVLGSVVTGTQYDTNGRVLKVSNPYQSTSDSTYGWTSNAYDGLDRKVQITEQDGSLAYKYYGPLVTSGGGASSQLCSGYGVGYPVLTKDEAGHKRQSWTDGFGRLIEVDEPDASNNLTVSTCYGYDLNDNLTSVVQSGSHSRTFAYDFLSRLISAQNPESGTITYSYDPNGNLATRIAPQANQTGTATTTTTYCYDALNRITGKKYAAASCPLSSPDVSYSYDGTGCPTGKTCFNIGHRTGMNDAAGSETWSYYYVSGTGDGVTDQRTTGNVSKSVVHAYNYDHTPASIIYPSLHTIIYGINSSEELTSVIDNTNSSNPINYATGGLYTPPGALASIFYGPSNILATWIFNPRLQPCRIAANTSGTAPSSCGDAHTGNVFDLAYNFSLGSDNGNVASVSNNLDPTRSQAFSYDPLNRLLTAQTTGTYANSPSRCWGESYQYDNQTSGGAWGNLTGIGGTSSSYNGCTQESLAILVGGNNQITTSGFGYDAAGNLITAPPTGTTYSYNAENQLAQAAGFVTAGYLYDGDGKRVAKTSAGTAYKLYWYGMNDAPLAESNGSGNITDEYIFFNGKRIARRVAH